jgi:hypothetical protein
MRKYMITVLMVISTIASVKAQYGNQAYAYNDDRYYYDNDFDWHWDIRVKISNGIQQGLLTQNESNRLYGILEDVERKEYAYQADGLFSGWEQQEIWDDVIYLNQRLGIELNDYDRSFYGFDVYGYDRRGYNKWFYQGGYDFFRFDKRGFGSIRLGYVPRPNYNGWYRNNNNHIAQRYYSERPHYDSRRGNYGGFERDNRNYGSSRGNNDYNRNRPYRDDFGRNSQGNNDYRRNDRIEMPNNRPNNNGNGFPNGGGRPERIEPSNNGNGFPNGGGRPERIEPSNNGNGFPNGGGRPERLDIPQGNSSGRPERTEPTNRSDNGNQGGGNGRSDAPQNGGNGGGGHRGPR